MKVKTLWLRDELIVFCDGDHWHFAAASKTIKEEDAERICREVEGIVRKIDEFVASIHGGYIMKAERGWRQ